MAVNEGIRSPFPSQPTARSSKLRFYESLFLLNQSVDQVAVALRRMMAFPFARKDSLQCAHDEVEEVRAGVNADFIEGLGDRERLDAARFWRRRRAYEKKLEDPDDVYINVERREKDRKKRGLPPRIGLIPYSAVSKQEERMEGAHGRQKNHSQKHRRD